MDNSNVAHQFCANECISFLQAAGESEVSPWTAFGAFLISEGLHITVMEPSSSLPGARSSHPLCSGCSSIALRRRSAHHEVPDFNRNYWADRWVWL